MARGSGFGMRMVSVGFAAVGSGLLFVLVACQSGPNPATAPASQSAVLAMLKTQRAPSAEALLGGRLFFEPALSGDGTLSCAGCHQPEKGFSDGRITAVGINGQKGTRRTPSIYGIKDLPHLFWDGRAKTLEEQALMPIANPIEMGADVDVVVRRLAANPTYRPAFEAVYGGVPTRERLAKALAAFERALTLEEAPFDRFIAGDTTAMTPQQQQGWRVFRGAGCAQCHTPPAFTDGKFHNIGQGTTLPHPDIGRMAVTQDKADWAAFKTPSLRNVAKRAPYMHDGTLRTLRAVLALYQIGGIDNPNKDPLLRPFPFMPDQRDALIAFLEALSSNDNSDSLRPSAQRR